ncbi:hypothetical protein [Thermococcus piezophilus]|uniref:Uncharacterized protein n=1 Tax=Thermococcus piezophilus TaxID=1712654 RepID=A0A172WGS5_9EURY|nr:hypothetical protein [Thermococcus piezophilus]ANF22644.1 hypothetical protein A7C91_05275 [Thermococcus piezophilus]
MIKKKIFNILLGLLVIGLVAVGAFTSEHSPQNAGTEKPIKNTVPVYYLGRDLYGVFETIHPFQNGIPKEAHILIVDGPYVAEHPETKESIKDELLRGIPVIVVNGHTEVIKSLLPHQFKPEIISGKTPDGRPIKGEKVYGYIVYPISEGVLVTKVFISPDPGRRAVEEAYRWAVRNMPPNAGTIDVSIESTGEWTQIYQLDFSTVDLWEPYGRLNVRSLYYKLSNDGSYTYDWYSVHVRQQSVPGEYLWDSSWKTADMYTWIDADYYNSDYFLSDYAPTTTVGSTTVGVSIGVSAGEDGASISASLSWSYTLPDVVVYDQSDYYLELAKWWHNVDEGAPVGSSTYQIEPGATIRVPQGSPMDWVEHYGAKYGKKTLFWWDYTTEGYVEFHIYSG